MPKGPAIQIRLDRVNVCGTMRLGRSRLSVIVLHRCYGAADSFQRLG